MPNRCLYWVRTSGTGLWSDPLNWSTVSPTSLGGASPPTSIDTVIFTGFANGSCVIEADISVGCFGVLGLGGGYSGIIDFQGYSVTIAGQLYLARFQFMNLTGTWSVGKLSFQGVSGTSLLTIRLETPWNIDVLDTFGSASACLVPQVGNVIRYCELQNVHLSLEVTSYYSINFGDTTNILYLPASITMELDAEIDGAVGGAGFLENFVFSASIYATAVLNICAGVETFAATTSAATNVVGTAVINIGLGVIQPLTRKAYLSGGSPVSGSIGTDVSSPMGGERTGDILDWRDPSKVLLTISGTPVDLTDVRLSLEQLTVTYDGKELTFSEVSTPGYGVWSYQNNQAVELQMNFGSGLKTYFRGKIKKTTPVGKNNGEMVSYVAFGIQNETEEVDVVNAANMPDDVLYQYTPLSLAIQQLFATNASALGSFGVGSSIGIPDTSDFTQLLQSEVRLKNTSFANALKTLVQQEPDKRAFWDDLQQKWIFPCLLDSPIVDIEVDLYRLDSHSYTVDTSNRYTALTYWSEGTANAETLEPGFGTVALLNPGWDSALEFDWTIRKGAGLGVAADMATLYSWVFRRWLLPDGFDVSKSEILGVYALLPFFGTDVWVPIKVEVNIQARDIFANVPIIGFGNPHDPGHSFGPLAVALLYVNKIEVRVDWASPKRIPATGFTGTAYSWFGIEREKKMIVPYQNFVDDYAENQLDILKDVLITADIPLFGDPLEQFMNLQTRIRLRDSSRTGGTGIDNIDAYLIRYTYKFGIPGVNILSVNNDKSKVLRTQ